MKYKIICLLFLIVIFILGLFFGVYISMLVGVSLNFIELYNSIIYFFFVY